MSATRAKKCPPPGAPAWLATFADLMSLLMCFFVLLLSFSEMDVQKYKQVAGSMKDAFGIQREQKTKEIPKGTSIVAQEFSPGKPRPTVLMEMREQTTDETKQNLDFSDAETKQQGPERGESQEQSTPSDQAMKIMESLKDEMQEGLLNVETEEAVTIIRIQEKGSFPSGSADLQASFQPVMEKIGHTLESTRGRIVVAGHTDNVPISTARFRSNWELSAARAVTVVHQLLADQSLDQERFVVEGRGDTVPLVPNDSPAHRARNRRVEIVIEEPGATG